MTTSPRVGRLALAALLPFAAACGDEDPVGPVDVLPVSAERLDALTATIAPVSDQPVLNASFFARFPRGLPLDEQNIPFAPAARGALDATSAGARVRAQFLVPPIRTITIPDSLRGLTFVVDRTLIGWRRDTLPDGRPRAGAPANGVRFVLTDALVFESTAPLGYMDVTQVGPATAPLLRVDVYDTTGTKVQHFAGALAASSLAGWTARGSVRIDEGTTRGRSGTTSGWSGSGVTLSADRTDAFGSRAAVVTTYRLGVDGTNLQLQSRERFDTERFETSYTVLVNGAPFAQRVDTFDGSSPWQHLASRRPLNAGELAQVEAFIGVLRALPSAEGAFQEALTNLMSLQRIAIPYASVR